jgi:hypothetical protein
MIAARRLQRGFADGFIAETVEDLWEPWMRHADKALEDDTLLLIIQAKLIRPIPPVGASDISFDLPAGWCWTRLGHLSRTTRGPP